MRRRPMPSTAITTSVSTLLLLFSNVVWLSAAFDRDELQSLAPDAIQQAFDEAQSATTERQSLQQACERLMQPPSILQRRHHAFLPASNETLQHAELAFIAERATELLAKKIGATRVDIDQFDNDIDIGGTSLERDCPDKFLRLAFLTKLKKESACSSASVRNIRTIDGTCNNLRRPLWGAAGTAFARLIAPVYEDGVSSPRALARSGRPLPSGRRVSVCTSPQLDKPHRAVTLALVFLGQIVDHDLGLAPMARVLDSSRRRVPPMCCNMPTECRHAECMPIDIDANDPVYGPRGIRCMEFARSLPALRESCRLGYREQVNEPTHYLDGSALYGNSRVRERRIRAFRDGLMRISETTNAHEPNVGELPPAEEENFECMLPRQGPVSSSSHHCFLAGDPRINEQPILTAYHTIFMREHNRVARELRRLSVERGLPVPTDEQLYQATRKIMIAFLQHIVYNEFLPAILGSAIIRGGKNELELCKTSPPPATEQQQQPAYCENGFYTGYSDQVPPHILQEFSTAAFRFGHTLLSDHLFRIPVNKTAVAASHGGRQRQSSSSSTTTPFQPTSTTNTTRLADNFFNPFIMFEAGAIGSLLYGCMLKNAETYDSTIVKSVRDELFKERNAGGIGMDLLAINIQRGRDHGIPGYTFYRKLCGLPPATTFDDLLDTMPADAVNRLRCAYDHVDDIDLFPGGIAERPVNSDDGVVGPTFACIIGQQFYQLKKADRFWYENRLSTAGGDDSPQLLFTLPQLDAIRHITLARLFCDNTDIERAQPWILLQPLPIINAEASCAQLPVVNLEPFITLTFNNN